MVSIRHHHCFLSNVIISFGISSCAPRSWIAEVYFWLFTLPWYCVDTVTCVCVQVLERLEAFQPFLKARAGC